MATKIAKVIFALVGLLAVVVGLAPILRGQAINTGALSTAAVFFLLALAVRPRRPPAPPPGRPSN